MLSFESVLHVGAGVSKIRAVTEARGTDRDPGLATRKGGSLAAEWETDGTVLGVVFCDCVRSQFFGLSVAAKWYTGLCSVIRYIHVFCFGGCMMLCLWLIDVETLALT